MGIKVVVEESGGLPCIEEGVYTAWFKGIEQRTIQVKGEERKIFSWKFLVDANGEKVELEGISSAKVTTKSKAYRWITAILGKKPSVGEEIDFDELVGLPCSVMIENKKTKNGDGEFSRVVEVMPAPKGVGKLSKEEMETEEEEEEDLADVEEEDEEEEEEEEEVVIQPPKKVKKKIKLK